jgi:hypothetical protein
VMRTKIMALHAETVGILIEKGRFEPEVALGIAEAIETSMTHAQFVTVPILDARLQELRADTRIALMSIENKLSTGFQEVDAKIDRGFAEFAGKTDHKFGEFEGKIDRKFAESEGKIDRRFGESEGKIDRKFGEFEGRFAAVDCRFAEFEGKIEGRFAKLEGKIDQKFAELIARMEGTKAELVRWVFLVMLGNVALGAGAAAMLEVVKHF